MQDAMAASGGGGDPLAAGGDMTNAPVPEQGATAGLAIGAAQGVFNAKDAVTTGFGLFGSAPKESERSGIRQAVDAAADANAQSQVGAWSQTLATAAVGLIGAGKLTAVVNGGKWTMAGVSALANSAVFQAHAQNFVNLAINNVPAASNPVTRFLATNPQDSDSLAYAKNALTSIGLDAAVVTTFGLGLSLIKAVKGGDLAAAEAAHSALAADQTAHAEASAAGEAPSHEPQEIASPEDAAARAAGTPAGRTGGPAIKGTGDKTGPGVGVGDNPQAALPVNDNNANPASQVAQGGGPEPLPAPDELKVVQSATSGAPGGKLPARPTLAPITDDQIAAIARSASADHDAIMQYGSWDNAIANGHTFGDDGVKIPYQQLTATTNTGAGASTSLDAFKMRVVATMADQLDEAKGGAVIGDAQNLSQVGRIASMWNMDPGSVMGLLNTAGSGAPLMRANMQASFMLAQRAMQDAWAMASRIKAGYLDEWNGSGEAANLALKQVTQAAVQFYGDGSSILANAGRTVRGAQGQFRMAPSQIAALNSLDGDHLVSLLQATQGSPAALKVALQPTLLQKLVDTGQLLRVNDLVSSPITHAIIFAGNVFQTVARPGMRVVGSKLASGMEYLKGDVDASGVATTPLQERLQNLSTAGQVAQKQYGYMAGTLRDAWDAGIQAWKTGDSVISPHNVEGTQNTLSQDIAQKPWTPVNTPLDLLSNAYTFLQKAAIVPGRIIGVQDELVKQVGYRAMVQAQAEVEGASAAGGGLTGQPLQDYVQNKLINAFDSNGRATNSAALQEAKVATFQNELPQTGWGDYGTQSAKLQSFVQNNPGAKMIFPFVRTPMNLFRQSVQLTPLLNMAQQEFNKGFSGAMGADAQALAHGQMAFGSLMLGVVGTMAYKGLITGDAPFDPGQRKFLESTGWQPNSIVIPDGKGGKTYIPFNRMDPIAMVFGAAANIASVLANPDPVVARKAQPMLAALATGILKQVTDKTYLTSMKQAVDMVSDPDHNLAKWAGQTVSGFIPLSSGLKVASMDPYQRDAQGFIDNALKNVPGYGASHLNPTRDWKGDPVTAHRGLWMDTEESRTNAEIQRLTLQQGDAIGNASPTATGGADLRGLAMAGNRDTGAAGRDAYDRFQELAGHPNRFPGANPKAKSLGDAVTEMIASPGYQKALDGTNGEKDTKMGMIAELVHGYRAQALGMMASDKAVSQAEQAENQRRANVKGTLTPNAPTAANKTDSFMSSLAKTFGMSTTTPPPLGQ